MKYRISNVIAGLAVAALFIVIAARPLPQETLKIGYVNSQEILAKFKDAQDAQKRLQEIIKGWEQEASQMQNQIRELQDQLESQSLLLSEEKKAEKNQELQQMYLNYQQFSQQKFGPQGEAYTKQQELMQPVQQKVLGVISDLGKEKGFDYIFDSVAGNIVFAADDQPDLTQEVIDRLNKTVSTKSADSKKGGKK